MLVDVTCLTSPLHQSSHPLAERLLSTFTYSSGHNTIVHTPIFQLRGAASFFPAVRSMATHRPAEQPTSASRSPRQPVARSIVAPLRAWSRRTKIPSTSRLTKTGCWSAYSEETTSSSPVLQVRARVPSSALSDELFPAVSTTQSSKVRRICGWWRTTASRTERF